MRRVVVTGMGIVSSIGNNVQEVTASLREAKSGIVKAEAYEKLGFRCQVHGAPTYDLDTVDRRVRRFMGDGAAWNYVAMQQAIVDSGLEEKDVKNDRTGIIARVTGFMAEHQGWILESSFHSDEEARRYFMRLEIRADSLHAVVETTAQWFLSMRTMSMSPHPTWRRMSARLFASCASMP